MMEKLGICYSKKEVKKNKKTTNLPYFLQAMIPEHDYLDLNTGLCY